MDDESVASCVSWSKQVQHAMRSVNEIMFENRRIIVSDVSVAMHAMQSIGIKSSISMMSIAKQHHGTGRK